MAKFRRRPDDDEDDDDDETLRDGHAARVPMMLRDSVTVHDGLGGEVGRRPGFAYLRDEAAVARARIARERAYADYERTLCDSWKGAINEIADEANDTAIADAAAHRDRTTPRPMSEVYSLYDQELRDAWKTKPSR